MASNFSLSNTRTWHVPYNGAQHEVYKVVDQNNVIIWRKYYKVSYYSNTSDFQYNTIFFNANGGEGTMDPINVDPKKSAIIPLFKFTYNGYQPSSPQFNTMPDGSGNGYSVGDTITPLNNIILYAQWKANLYNITFNPNNPDQTGGSGSMDAIKNVAYNSNVELPLCEFSKDGYKFDSWICYIDNEYSYYVDGQTITMPNQDIQLSAQWTLETSLLLTEDGIPLATADGQDIAVQ